MATYKRPERLKNTLMSIQKQDFTNFEIIISDNDRNQSGREIVEKLKDNRLLYYNNNNNLGMLKNFNNALSHASGEYIVFITDDDPPNKILLSTVVDLMNRYPGYGAYYGGCEVFVEDQKIIDYYSYKCNKINCLANIPKDKIRIYDNNEFIESFYQNKIFPYFLWSTGIVRKDIILEVGGVPDYGTPYLGDFAYISLVCSHSGCVTINKILGRQTVHGKNFGREEYNQLYLAIAGYYKYIKTIYTMRNQWSSRIAELVSGFLYNWIIAHTNFLIKYFEGNGRKDHVEKILSKILKLKFMIKIIKKDKFKKKINKILYPLKLFKKLIKKTIKTIVIR